MSGTNNMTQADASKPTSVSQGKPSRGRGASNGRGRGGRGRPNQRFQPRAPQVEPASQVMQTASDTPRKFPEVTRRRRSNAQKPSANIIATTTAAERVVKELPPHIAGAAVDAEVLVTRVRELAIRGHKHTYSSTSINWADEEDPDSLPDLNDWMVHSKLTEVEAIPEVLPIEKPSEESASEESEEIKLSVELPTLPKEQVEHYPVKNEFRKPKRRENRKSSVPPERPSATNSQPIEPLPPSNDGIKESVNIEPPSIASKRRYNERPRVHQHVPRSQSLGGQSKFSHLPYHPSNLNRGFVPPFEPQQPSSVPREARRAQSLKQHSRPVLTSDALARISRTLGNSLLQHA